VRRHITILPALLLLAMPVSAAVRFADWSPQSAGALLVESAEHDRLVMVVITQPDWCPGCIALDRDLLRNPEAHDVAELTRDWTVMEVLGYDEPDATFLAAQGLSFLGTPTTLLLRPRVGDATLGAAQQLGAIVGYPDDYLTQLERAASGHDAIAEAIARLRRDNDVESLGALAEAYLAAGDAAAARRVFKSMLLREELDGEARRRAALDAVVLATQRVEKDHERTLRELAAWAEHFPEGREDPDYVYALAWSTLALGRLEEARAILAEAYLTGDDPGQLAEYLYMVFRHPSEALLEEAEQHARRAIERFPEQAARFHAAHGRILRRQGRLAEAEEAFVSAVAKVPAQDSRHGTYLGQLEFVRRELAAAR
jgi:tetratricopeptide (TPR) repeat protein